MGVGGRPGEIPIEGHCAGATRLLPRSRTGHCDSEPKRTGPEPRFYEAPPEGSEPSHSV